MGVVGKRLFKKLGYARVIFDLMKRDGTTGRNDADCLIGEWQGLAQCQVGCKNQAIDASRLQARQPNDFDADTHLSKFSGKDGGNSFLKFISP